MITAMQDDSVIPSVSKTRRKKEMLQLQALGVALVDLPDAQIHAMGLSDRLREAVLEAKRIKAHEGRRRQLQYIGRLMREVDPAPLRERLDAILGGSVQEAARHRRLEALRERLIADDEALTDFVATHPGADLQVLRTLIRNTRKEQKEGKPPRAFRELFRVLKSLDAAAAASS
jgi:ribosome-associated protein